MPVAVAASCGVSFPFRSGSLRSTRASACSETVCFIEMSSIGATMIRRRGCTRYLDAFASDQTARVDAPVDSIAPQMEQTPTKEPSPVLFGILTAIGITLLFQFGTAIGMLRVGEAMPLPWIVASAQLLTMLAPTLYVARA